MTVADIRRSVKFVVDPSGQQSAVVIDMEVWEEVEWALFHHGELRENWKLVQSETPPNKIAPLE